MGSSPNVQSRSRVGWSVLVGALVLEAFLLLWVVYISVLGTINEQGSFGQGLSLVATAVLSLIWVVVTLVAAARTKASWARASAITIHVLLFAAGTGLLQTQIGPTLLGFGLIALALVGFLCAIVARPAVSPHSAAAEDEGAEPDRATPRDND